jgi:hypothetical protein
MIYRDVVGLECRRLILHSKSFLNSEYDHVAKELATVPEQADSTVFRLNLRGYGWFDRQQKFTLSLSDTLDIRNIPQLIKDLSANKTREYGSRFQQLELMTLLNNDTMEVGSVEFECLLKGTGPYFYKNWVDCVIWRRPKGSSEKFSAYIVEFDSGIFHDDYKDSEVKTVMGAALENRCLLCKSGEEVRGYRRVKEKFGN